ncbi:MAG: iron-containing alcohol dehydrogenase [Pseudomonadota bacterium]|nr:iron-containing alcohol dehydrogenase [Pseudomonadota bacterium]
MPIVYENGPSMTIKMRQFFFNTCPDIRFGSGIVREVASDLVRLLGKNILLVSDQGLTALGLYQPLLELLRVEGANIVIFDSVKADPDVATVLECVQFSSKNKITGVIGFGGGSSLDVAKTVSLLLGSREELDDIWGVGNAKGPRTPICLIPTTAGTGSEVTPVAIITTGKEEKKGIVSSLIIPDIAVLDPDLTKDLPQHIAAATGIDAMVHAIEAYTSENSNNNHLSKLLAKEALMLLGHAIKPAVLNGSDLGARGEMLLGAMLAGMAFANSPVGAVHALAYPIGGTFHIPHGLSNALVLPEVLKFNSKAAKTAKDYKVLNNIVFSAESSFNEKCDSVEGFSKNMKKLALELGLPVRLRDVGIPRDACPKLAADAMRQIRLLVNNPTPVTEFDALRIYMAVW